MNRERTNWATWLLAIAAFVVIASPQHYRSDIRTANEASRIYAVMAIVDHGVLRLDPVFDAEAPGWRERGRPPNVDVARRGSHYYLDKAPGISLAAVPLVAALDAIGIELGYAELAWLLALVFAGLPTILLFLWLLRWLRRSFGSDSPVGAVASALIVASPLLIYGGLLFSHALAAALVGVGLTLALGPIAPGEGREAGATVRRPVAMGGLVLGAAVLVEYAAGLAALVAVAALAADSTRRRRLPWLVLGGLAPAVVLAIWNTVAFGGPLELSYSYKATAHMADAHSRGLYGIGAPSADSLWGLIGSARRGLLFLAPWLAAGIVGAVWAASSRAVSRAWRVALPALVLGAPVLVAGFGDWHGGRALGPRYLLFALPVFAIAAAFLVDRIRSSRAARYLYPVGLGIVLSSFLLALAGAYVFPYASTELANPLFEVNVPVLLNGGPCATAWEWVLPASVGVAIAVLAMAVVLLLLVYVSALRARGRVHRPAPVASLLCVAAAAIHLAAATVPESPISRRREVLRERSFTHTYLGQHQAAARVDDALEPRRR